MSALHKEVVQRQMASKATNESHNANCNQMEGEQAMYPALAHANKLIDNLIKDILPEVPYLLTVPTRNPYRPTFPHEHINSPFEPHEQHLQYMTFLQDGRRGVMVANGSWQEEMAGTTPNSTGVQSSTGTPNPKDAKKPSQKMSFSDYKKFKESGVTPTLKPGAPTSEPSLSQGERSMGHERSISSTSVEKLASVAQSKGRPEVIVNGVKSSIEPVKTAVKEQTLATQPSNPKDVDKPRPVTNGIGLASDEAKNAKAAARLKENVPHKDIIQHKLPPRPRSPQATTEGKLQKRPRENEVLPPEKRTKMDAIKAPSARPVPTKSSNIWKTKATHSIAAVNGMAKSAKTSEAKLSAKKPTVDKSAVNLPPFHSPLPQDLAAYADQTVPDDTQVNGHDTAIQPFNGHGAKQSNTGSDSPNSSPLSTPPKSSPMEFVLPQILSPTLPEEIEQALRRPVADIGKSTPPLTVEGRHEKARQPDTPGVARKVKVGHPPKRRSDESSSSIRSRDPSRGPTEKQTSLIVKIPIKKKARQDVQRILKLPAKSDRKSQKLEAEKLSQASIVVAHPKGKKSAALPSDSEDEALQKTSSAKKRPSEGLTSEPAAKRTKIPKSIDVAKASTPAPAFKSPVTSAPTPQKLLATPKKGDAIKEVAMRRLDSAESHDARTPQTTITSTPASAEKPRINGEVHRLNPELDRLTIDFDKYNSLARTLKHARDPIVKDLPSSHPDFMTLRLRAACTGIESLLSWMIAFEAQEKINTIKGKRDTTMWESLIAYLRDVERHTSKDKTLHAVTSNLAALCCEVYVKQVLNSGGDGKTLLEKVKENDRNRTKYWKWAEEEKGAIALMRGMGHGKDEITLGPWITDMRYAARWALTILQSWEAEKKCGWKKELDF